MTWISTPRGVVRREWDSNPRYPYEYTRLPSVHLRPLGHLSQTPWMEQGRCVQGCTSSRPSATESRSAAAYTEVRSDAQHREPESTTQSRGESGIRTHGAASGSTVFETARFDRSRISPSARVPGRLRAPPGDARRLHTRRRTQKPKTRSRLSRRGRRPGYSCPRGFEPPTFRSAV